MFAQCAVTTSGLPISAHAQQMLPWLRKINSIAIMTTMLRSVKVSFVQTAALVHAEKHFPMKTPMRWQLIAKFVAKCVPVLSKPLVPLMVLGSSSATLSFSVLRICANLHLHLSTIIILSC